AQTNISVEVNDDVVQNLIDFCINSSSHETGGILIGQYTENKMKAVVTKVIDAPADSIRQKYHFKRGIVGLQPLLNKLWKKNEYYLGEWHFHPFSASNPSGTDDFQMFKFADDPRLNCPEPILLILGGNPNKSFDINVLLYKNKMKLKLNKIGNVI
ncbi:MAG: Mov34/MPN/PAD-1 family protein, partial [Selenomonadaceae bacterium]